MRDNSRTTNTLSEMKMSTVWKRTLLIVAALCVVVLGLIFAAMRPKHVAGGQAGPCPLRARQGGEPGPLAVTPGQVDTAADLGPGR